MGPAASRCTTRTTTQTWTAIALPTTAAHGPGVPGHGRVALLTAITGYVDDERSARREHGDGGVTRRRRLPAVAHDSENAAAAHVRRRIDGKTRARPGSNWAAARCGVSTERRSHQQPSGRAATSLEASRTKRSGTRTPASAPQKTSASSRGYVVKERDGRRNRDHLRDHLPLRRTTSRARPCSSSSTLSLRGPAPTIRPR